MWCLEKAGGFEWRFSGWFDPFLSNLSLFCPQLTFLPNRTLASQRTTKLPAAEAVHHIMTFDPNNSNFLYVMTSHHVSTQPQTIFQSVDVYCLSSQMSSWRKTTGTTFRIHLLTSSGGSLLPSSKTWLDLVLCSTLL